MSYDFLGLVNDACRRLNEPELTTSNFASAKAFYAQIKDAVNNAIADINQQKFEWPFNHVTQEDTLTAGTTRYGYPDDAKTVDFDSFRIKESSTLNVATTKLSIVSYEDYLDKYIDQEYSSDTSKRDVPKYVFRSPALEYGVVPAPDQAYTLLYEYYRNTVSLIDAQDVPSIPEMFRNVINEGTMYYCYMFRSNEQAATLADARFKNGIKNMTTLLINRFDYVRSTMIPSNKHVIAGARLANG
jgi:hypothetical protein